jgi:hypothetical protein
MISFVEGRWDRNVDLLRGGEGEFEVLAMVLPIEGVVLEEVRTIAVYECAATVIQQRGGEYNARPSDQLLLVPRLRGLPCCEIFYLDTFVPGSFALAPEKQSLLGT